MERRLHQQAVDRFAVTADLLVTVHAVGRSFQPLQRALARQQRIPAQLVAVVEVFLSQLRDQLPHAVFDAPVDNPQQKRAAVGTDHPAVEAGAYLAPKMPGKGEAGLATLC